LPVFRPGVQNTDFVKKKITVNLEQSLFSAGFEPDVFSTEDIEKEWKPDADRASICKIVLPELLRDDKQAGIIV
jgi:hypothetical protein